MNFERGARVWALERALCRVAVQAGASYPGWQITAVTQLFLHICLGWLVGGRINCFFAVISPSEAVRLIITAFMQLFLHSCPDSLKGGCINCLFAVICPWRSRFYENNCFYAVISVAPALDAAPAGSDTPSNSVHAPSSLLRPSKHIRSAVAARSSNAANRSLQSPAGQASQESA